MDKQFLAQEAQRLRTDPVFKEALSRIKAEAIVELISASPDDKSNIIRLQQIAWVCDRIYTEIEAMIQSGGEHKPFKAAV